MKPNFELLAVEGRDELGEGPWWDAAAGLLWWVDIPSRRIRRATLNGIESPALATPSDVGFAVPDSAGGVIAGLATGLARQSQGSDTWAPLWSADHDPALLRLNDGKTDRRGGLWFGSMHRDETEAVGALFRLTEGGVVTVLDGITTSNGLGWSPDERTFYYTDSIARTIWAFDADPETGTLSNRRTFATDTDCYPDGLTVDADGAVWAAKWDGARIVRYRPNGEADRVIELPVMKPTSVAFSGPSLDVLVVTSARKVDSDGELSGSVFLLDVGVSGLAERPADASRL